MATRSKSTSAEKGRSTDSEHGMGEQVRLKEVLVRLEETTTLWQDFLGAHRAIMNTMADQMLRDHNLALEWFDVLIHLADVPGGALRQRELRDRLLLSESGVSRLLARMEKAGMITRQPADDDKRGVEIALTALGRSMFLEATESHLKLVSELFIGRLTRTDLSDLARILPKLGAAKHIAMDDGWRIGSRRRP